MPDKTQLITAPKLCARLGISQTSLWRWQNDAALKFPRPLKVRARNYYRLAEVETWLARQQSGRERARL